jgi:hypothetical protein
VFVKDPGIIGQGLHRHTSNTNHVGSLEDAQRGIAHKRSAQTLPMATQRRKDATSNFK